MSSKSTNGTSSRGSSARSKQDARIMAQTPIDAKLASDFEKSRPLFDYSSSIDVNFSTSTDNIPSSTVSSYLQKIQRGSLIQSFGCLIAIEERDFRVLAYSENSLEMLDLNQNAVPNIQEKEVLTFGTDVRTLFTSSSASSLEKAVRFPEVNLLNPILVHCKNSRKPFYAILHRIDVGLVIDLEPVSVDDTVVTTAGALKSYKLAAKSISRLQSLPSHNISLLCDGLVKEVRELTGYDRVMVYKFHEDEHGEVIAEYCTNELEPYLGLHYPATDIPQASRFLFLKNKVRMICDCLASPIKVIQDEKLTQPLSLGGSTLRAPHGCHAQYMANMGTIASLVMAVTINEEDDDVVNDRQKGRKLWGLVVCHHTKPRFVPFPQRYACEFLVQVFSIQISKEIELAAQMREKHILRIQTVLCDMFMRDSPIAIMTQSPNVMDLVKCDGASLFLNTKVWLLGVTPTEKQIRDLAQWFLHNHRNTNGLTTDSLKEAGYPNASELSEAICGMVAVKITSKDVLFWFRSHTAKEVKWGGAKHDPIDKDDRRKMHPRSSFKAFLEVVKWRSLPWEDMEMDAIHSLQLILRGLLKDIATNDSKIVTNNSKMIVNVPGNDSMVNKLQSATSEMIRLIETAIVPIFSVDAYGVINGWNAKMGEITGLLIERAIGLPLVDVVVDEMVDIVKNMLSLALQGGEEKNIEVRFKTFDSLEKNNPLVVVNSFCNWDSDRNITGICFIGQDVTLQKRITDQYTQLQGDYTGIVRNPNHLIPPIFIMDEQGLCLEWNYSMEKLSGFRKEETIGRMLLGEVFTTENIGCRVKDEDTLIRVRILLSKTVIGENTDKVCFVFLDKHGRCIETLLSASPRIDSDGNMIGVLCFLHLPSPELQYILQVQSFSKEVAEITSNKVTYLREQIRNPILGMKFTRKLAEKFELSGGQKQLLVTKSLCEDQLMKIVDDIDIPSIEEGYMETSTTEFNLGEVIEAVISQVMPSCQETHVQLLRNSPAELSSMNLYGDNLRLQQVLSDFLNIAVRFTPPFGGSSVMFMVNSRMESVGTKMQLLHLEFRIIHPSPGVPEDLIQEMFHRSTGMSREGLGLYISHKLVRIMNGTLQYLRGQDYSSFVILLQFPLIQQTAHE